MTETELVLEFAKAADDFISPTPCCISKEKGLFLVHMMVDEILEFMATLPLDLPGTEILAEIARNSTPRDNLDWYPKTEEGETQQIADQADALVDLNYYAQHIAVQHGINLSSVFRLVHESNMNKRDPYQGVFLRRLDGKIMKPANWTPPNILQEIFRQKRQGSFTQQKRQSSLAQQQHTPDSFFPDLTTMAPSQLGREISTGYKMNTGELSIKIPPMMIRTVDGEIVSCEVQGNEAISCELVMDETTTNGHTADGEVVSSDTVDETTGEVSDEANGETTGEMVEDTTNATTGATADEATGEMVEETVGEESMKSPRRIVVPVDATIDIG